MDEKLNIKSSFPLFGSSIKVKGLDQKEQDVRDRSFDRHLKKDADKKKKENREEINQPDIAVINQREEPNVDSSMNESIHQNNKCKQIDILA